MRKPQAIKYEYKEITKETCTSCIEELNKLGRDGWLVVACYGNTLLLVRER